MPTRGYRDQRTWARGKARTGEVNHRSGFEGDRFVKVRDNRANAFGSLLLRRTARPLKAVDRPRPNQMASSAVALQPHLNALSIRD